LSGSGFGEIIVMKKMEIRRLLRSLKSTPEECGVRPNWARNTGRPRVIGAAARPRVK
jgi:hypothetical protein